MLGRCWSSPYISYGTETIGTSLKLGIPLREDLTMQLRYSIYWQQIKLYVEHGRLQQYQPGFP